MTNGSNLKTNVTIALSFQGLIATVRRTTNKIWHSH